MAIKANLASFEERRIELEAKAAESKVAAWSSCWNTKKVKLSNVSLEQMLVIEGKLFGFYR